MKNTTRSLRLVPAVAVGVLLLAGCEYREVDGVGTRTHDEEFVPQDDVTAFDGCARTDLGQWQPSGTVTNNTPDMATYALTVAFYDGDTRVDERTMWLRDLRPGETGDVNRAWWISGADDVTGCELLTVDRFTTPIEE